VYTWCPVVIVGVGMLAFTPSVTVLLCPADATMISRCSEGTFSLGTDSKELSITGWVKEVIDLDVNAKIVACSSSVRSVMSPFSKTSVARPDTISQRLIVGSSSFIHSPPICQTQLDKQPTNYSQSVHEQPRGSTCKTHRNLHESS